MLSRKKKKNQRDIVISEDAWIFMYLKKKVSNQWKKNQKKDLCFRAWLFKSLVQLEFQTDNTRLQYFICIFLVLISIFQGTQPFAQSASFGPN